MFIRRCKFVYLYVSLLWVSVYVADTYDPLVTCCPTFLRHHEPLVTCCPTFRHDSRSSLDSRHIPWSQSPCCSYMLLSASLLRKLLFYSLGHHTYVDICFVAPNKISPYALIMLLLNYSCFSFIWSRNC